MKTSGIGFTVVLGFALGIVCRIINPVLDVHLLPDPHVFPPEVGKSLLVPYIVLAAHLLICLPLTIDIIRMSNRKDFTRKPGTDFWSQIFNSNKKYSTISKILGYSALLIIVYFGITITGELIHIMEHKYRDIGYPFGLMDLAGIYTLIAIVWWVIAKTKEEAKIKENALKDIS